MTVSRAEALAIFLGTSQLTPALPAAFARGLHLALIVGVIPVPIALALSVLRGTELRGTAARPH